MSAVAIGRMRAVPQTAGLRAIFKPALPPTRLGMAIRWALMALTNEPIAEPEPIMNRQTGWFLEPLDD